MNALCQIRVTADNQLTPTKKLQQFKAYKKAFKQLKKDSLNNIQKLIDAEVSQLTRISQSQPFDSLAYYQRLYRIDSIQIHKKRINWDSLEIVYGKHLRIFLERHIHKLSSEELPTTPNSDVVSDLLEPIPALSDSGLLANPRNLMTKQAKKILSDEIDNVAIINKLNDQISLYKKKYIRAASLNKLNKSDKINNLSALKPKERIVVGGNINFQIRDTLTTTNFNVKIGYQLNKKLSAGVLGSYEFFTKYEPNFFYVNSNSSVGFGGFTRYDMKKSFLLYSEFERKQQQKETRTEPPEFKYEYALYLGVGKTLMIKQNRKISGLVLYNVLYSREKNIIYETPWSFRLDIGIHPLKEKLSLMK